MRLSVKLKQQVAEYSLEYLENLWKSLSYHLFLPPPSVLLDAVFEKSIVVVWLIPKELAVLHQVVEKAQQSTQFFQKHLILSVTIGDVCVYTYEDSKCIGENSGKKNLCAVLRSVGDLRLEERAIPQPAKGEVLLSMQSVGICQSDVHFWVAGRIGDCVVESPMVLGHECSGVVSALGEGVTRLKVGDHVAIEPGSPCWMCSLCKSGQYNLCLDVNFCSASPTDGALARYHVHEADLCFRLPDHVSLDEGALLEPLSVGVHACQRAGVKMGSRVLICGAGPIGLVCLQIAKASGACKVVIMDLEEIRLRVAKELGADYTVTVATKDSRAVARQIKEVLGYQADQAIECIGAESSIATAIYGTRSGGVVAIVGLGASEINIPIVDATLREIDIRGVFCYCNCYPTALELVASGKVNVKPLVTHTYKLEETLDAFERAKTMAGGVIKVMIRCAEEKF